ncbi:MAG TPA: prepilin-type N-terminal cleavage/methylation domain-containing protein, partial [Planctomycetota bacterium]|nr:prepilin-type N-terminal cleavage/methylation domain-containing protein [Planctomycetota bacterium]
MIRAARLSYPARGMTLLEVMVTTVLFALLVGVAYTSLQSVRAFTRTNSTQIDLQESARHALERMIDTLRNSGRFTGNNNKPYPCIFKSASGLPTGYNNANAHPPKVNPKAKPGSNANGGDPTLDSDEIIFKLPSVDANNIPVMSNGRIQWAPQELGFFIVPGPDNINQLELRDSAVSAAQQASGQKVQGTVICRYVDRIQIEDYTTDPTLTMRQLRITLYLTRIV